MVIIVIAESRQSETAKNRKNDVLFEFLGLFPVQRKAILWSLPNFSTLFILNDVKSR